MPEKPTTPPADAADPEAKQQKPSKKKIPKDERPYIPPRPKMDNIVTRHPVVGILSSLVGIALCGGVLGYCTAGESPSNTASVTAGPAPEQGGLPSQLTNTNPHGALACAMVVTHTGNGNAPYRLDTYITQGTPDSTAHATYSITYKKPGSGDAHQIGPFVTSLTGEPAIPATDQNAALATVNGQIEGAQSAICTVTIAQS
jgi:outer membrane biosynthesis protein TonB